MLCRRAYDQATNYEDMAYELITAKGCKPVKAWVRGVALEPEARKTIAQYRIATLCAQTYCRYARRPSG